MEAYLNWIRLRRQERPVDGIVLTEHRQFNRDADYRDLEDKFGILILKATEAETDYGHMLVFGVNEDIVRRFDFSNVRIPAQELIDEVARMGGVVVPCHPGRSQRRPVRALCEQAAAGSRSRVVELLNGGSRRGEDERTADLVEKFGYRATGGSDSHLVSGIAVCATRFEAEVKDVDALVREAQDRTL